MQAPLFKPSSINSVLAVSNGALLAVPCISLSKQGGVDSINYPVTGTWFGNGFPSRSLISRASTTISSFDVSGVIL